MANWKNRIIGYGIESPELLKANPKNWRKHPPHQAAALTGVLSDVGVVQNVIVNKTTGRLVDGHLRIELALKTHQKTIPVTYVELSEAEESEILATLDPVSALATADKEKLEDVLGEVSSADEAVKKLLNDLALKSGIKINGEIVEDEAHEPPGEPKTVKGDLYELGRHRLLCGDSANSDDVAKLMDGRLADCVFTSPPYGVGLEYGEYVDTIENLRDMLPALAAQWILVVPPGGFAVVNFGDIVSAQKIVKTEEPCELPMALEYWPVFRAAGWMLWSRRIWCKPGARTASMQCISSNRAATNWEHVWTWKRPGHPVVDRQIAGQYASQHGWFDTSRDTGVEVKANVHAGVMATSAARWMIAVHSRDGGVIHEPFCGSGTTLIASDQLGRCCYAMEIEPKYCDVTVSRWVKFTGGKVRRNGEEIEWAAPV